MADVERTGTYLQRVLKNVDLAFSFAAEMQSKIIGPHLRGFKKVS